MKRTRHITLCMLAAVSVLALAACDDNEEARQQNEFWKNHGYAESDESKVFQDQADCQASHTADECLEGVVAAKREHARTAPQFPSRDACEAQYGEGNCGELSSADASVGVYGNQGHRQNPFVPVMKGFMMGMAARNAAPVYYGRPRTCRDDPNLPGCNGSTSGNSTVRPAYSGPIIIGNAGSASSYRNPSVTSPPSIMGGRSSGSSGGGGVSVARGGFGGIGSGVGASS